MTNYIDIDNMSVSTAEQPKKKTQKKQTSKKKKTVAAEQSDNVEVKEQLRKHIKEQMKTMVLQQLSDNNIIATPVPEKKKLKKFEYTVMMIDWNEPELTDWSYESMGNEGWVLCNVELNTRTDFTTATFKREIDTTDKFEYEIKTRYWSNRLPSDKWTYEELGLEGWELCHILDDSESEMTEYYFIREKIEDAE